MTIRATTPGCQAGLVRGHGIGPSCMAAAGVGLSVHIRSGGRDREAECAWGRRAAETTGGAGSTEIKLGCVPPRRAKSRPGASRACRFVRTMLDRGVAAEDDRAIFSGGALAVHITHKSLYRALQIPNVHHRRGAKQTNTPVRYCQVDEKLVDHPPRCWARARREPAMLGIRNGRQPQLDNTSPHSTGPVRIAA